MSSVEPSAKVGLDAELAGLAGLGEGVFRRA